MAEMDDATRASLAQRILRAAQSHDVIGLRKLLILPDAPAGAANVVEDGTRRTPLHLAVVGCESSSPSSTLDKTNGAKEGSTTISSPVPPPAKKQKIDPAKEEAAAAAVELLLENGGIWNDLDANDETPGCIAYRLGLDKVYELLVEAGVRAELLLARLDGLGLGGGAAEEDDGDEQEEVVDAATEGSVHDDQRTTKHEETAHAESHPGTITTNTSQSQAEPPEDYIDHWDSNNAYLASSLRFTETTLLDSSSNAVMMDWETEIMTRHADTLAPTPGLRVMNVGHGMGIVDTALQARQPAEHHIVEAHPTILAKMRENGWLEKPGVHVHEGRWQDVLPRLLSQGVVLDAIYYDTFAEDYSALREFFSEPVVGLLAENGRFGFYHGLGADRQVCYDVYTRVVELDLRDVGFVTKWEDIKVPPLDWKGVRRPYWNVGTYRLPVCTFAD